MSTENETPESLETQENLYGQIQSYLGYSLAIATIANMVARVMGGETDTSESRNLHRITQLVKKFDCIPPDSMAFTEDELKKVLEETKDDLKRRRAKPSGPVRVPNE